MTGTPAILKNPKLKHDEDYNFLIGKGREYIEELGHDLWTDYNEHDPGITILEALCYSITELGFRTSFPVKDLLTGIDGTIPNSQTFFTAKEILTQSALNIDDYRKMLIDIEGVANAWLYPYFTNMKDTAANAPHEPLFYADIKQDKLTFTPSPPDTKPVFLRGLYRILLDLDDDAQLGDLNNGEITLPNPKTSAFNAGEVYFTVAFPSWAGQTTLWDTAITAVTIAGHSVAATTTDGEWLLTIKYKIGSTTSTLTGNITIDLESSNANVATADLQSFFAVSGFPKLVFTNYLQKIQKAKGIVTLATDKLYAHRNLCEDFATVTTIQDEDISICCDIDISPDTDMAFVQASVCLAIENYLNPPVGFYLLKDMTARGYTMDEIFEGPRLKHGFIDTTELENSKLLTEIHASEMINRIMGIEGVLSVRNFRMTAYDDNGVGIPSETGKQWCIDVTPWRKPVLAEQKSKIVFYKNQFPYLAGSQEMQDILQWLKSRASRDKLAKFEDDLPIPTGTYFPLDGYTSVQALFPVTFGVGNAGLPPNSAADRIAQTRQLKAYLLFYDQLLADFFSQLKNAGELFSTDKIVQTYYGQFVNGFKDAANIYNNTNGGLQNVLASQNSVGTAAADAPWQQLYEDDDTFTDRRNRFLDHLMSRFAESFNDYVFLMYSLDYDTQQETAIDPADIIKSKIEFLKDYPDLSYNRAKGYNYLPLKDHHTKIKTAKLWDTANVSGLEKKLCLLGGFKDPSATIQSFYRRHLSYLSNAVIIPNAAKFQYTFSNGGNTLTSTHLFNTDTAAMKSSMSDFLPLAQSENGFVVTKSGTKWLLSVSDAEGGQVAACAPLFSTKTAAVAAMNAFITLFNTECDHEGLHLIEHILLRPRSDGFKLAPVCLEPGCDFCGDEDPYSFRITIVLPYWPAHFQNMAFRTYFENIARTEAPAHCTVKVCWINDASMIKFETAYRHWIDVLAKYMEQKTNITALQNADNTLLNLLFNLHSEYPVATLHDCDESKDVNPVMLGKTILGTFKN
jgi:hypothetical protein